MNFSENFPQANRKEKFMNRIITGSSVTTKRTHLFSYFGSTTTVTSRPFHRRLFAFSKTEIHFGRTKVPHQRKIYVKNCNETRTIPKEAYQDCFTNSKQRWMLCMKQGRQYVRLNILYFQTKIYKKKNSETFWTLFLYIYIFRDDASFLFVLFL